MFDLKNIIKNTILATILLFVLGIVNNFVAFAAIDPLKKMIIHDEPIEVDSPKFQSADGKEVGIPKGKTVIIYFFASWCGDCLQEVEWLQELDKQLHKRIKDDKFEIIFASVDFKKPKEVIEFLEEYGIKNIEIVFDPKQQNMKKLKVLSVPTTVILNEKDQEIIRATRKTNWLQHNLIDFLVKNIDKTAEK